MSQPSKTLKHNNDCTNANVNSFFSKKANYVFFSTLEKIFRGFVKKVWMFF